MLRKIFLLSWLLGLSLVICGPGLAGEYPAVDGIDGPINILTGLKKDAPLTPLDTANVFLANVPVDGMPLSKPADYCQDYNVRSSSSGYNGIWGFPRQGIGYFVLQDIESTCPYARTVDVQSVRFLAYDYYEPGEITMRAEFWTADLTDPSCPVPGELITIGPDQLITYPGGSGYMWIELQISPYWYDYSCIDGLYFIAVRFTSNCTAIHLVTVSSDDLVENDGLSPILCKWYLEDPANPGVYEDMGNGFDNDEASNDEARDWYIYSTALTEAQNYCHTPGICEWDWEHCVWETNSYYNFKTPSSDGARDYIWQKWESIYPCTLNQINLYAIGVYSGDPGVRVSIHDWIWEDSHYMPGEELYYEERPTSEINQTGWNSFLFPDQQPVIVQGAFFIFVGRASWASDGDTLVIPMDDPVACPVFTGCVSGFRMGAADPGTDVYICEHYGLDNGYELFAELHICRPDTYWWLPKPDDWPTHGHDYARTCATEMGVCGPKCPPLFRFGNGRPAVGVPGGFSRNHALGNPEQPDNYRWPCVHIRGNTPVISLPGYTG